MTHTPHRVGLLLATPALEGLTAPDLESLAAVAETVLLSRGDVLMREGAPAHALYFVVTGRLGVFKEGVSEPVAEIGQGQPVGEIGFFAGLARTATVVALRDSSVLGISREQFDQISETSPRIRQAIVVSLARRLASAPAPRTRAAPGARTLALLPAGESDLRHSFVEAFREAVGSEVSSLFLRAEDVATRFPGGAVDDQACTTWLNVLESETTALVYVADRDLTDWTRKCINQADALLLVAEAGAGTTLNASERLAFGLHAPSARRLAIVHGARTDVASGTGRWLAERDVRLHHHVALCDAADVRRLARFVLGRAVGFVAGGGGALGSAHLGAYKALCEAGAEFDILGGTSVGAAMAAGLAAGASPERVDAGSHNIFVKSRAFKRVTLPFFGLLDHTVFDKALRAEYGDMAIEDLWRPLFAVSSNLSDHGPYVHRRGPVWEAVRASSSIPGVLPPFFTKEGIMLVDGGLMDNVPLTPMKALKTGPNVVVALGSTDRRSYPVDYAAIPGLGGLVGALLNPFRRQRLPKIPSILQVITLGMLARSQDLDLDQGDVLIRPTLPAGVRFSSWERHHEIFQHSHLAVASWIQLRLAQGDAGLNAVIRTRP